ncbi:GrpB family protein [Paenibacillus donghaensis]|uniref:GrpB family protein n=1 Tax=Paenibacillus donghaensis TaxID=414771 RepID=UPI001883FD08|nr:GrpB family protein [Paenibacillus donghaensis]MBE9918263.1 GrpB family protein [Paenibacillus donghaensis]
MTETRRVIEVVPYNPEWETEFERIKKMIWGYIGDYIVTIEHVGSTSVEGLSAKPIIDLDVVMESYDVFPEIVQRLGEHGYEHEGNFV